MRNFSHLIDYVDVYKYSLVLVPICHYAGSSHLLGAFLAGLMFCSEPCAHHAWTNQVKRIMQWLLRIFFATTIGFQVPPINKIIKDKSIILCGLLYFASIIGKFFTGYFAISFNEKLQNENCIKKIFSKIKDKHFQIVSLAMSCWGEFTFILANKARRLDIMDDKTFSSIIVAALLSIITTPYLLRYTLDNYNKSQRTKINKVKNEGCQQITLQNKHGECKEISISHTHFGSELHPIYFVIDIKSFGLYGQSDLLLDVLMNKCQLIIVDYRSWHPHIQPHPVVLHEIYVKTGELNLPPTKYLDNNDKKKLCSLARNIKTHISGCLDRKNTKNVKIEIKRWLPYIRKEDDHIDPLQRIQNVKYQRNCAYYEAAKRFEERAKIHNSATHLLSSLSRMHKLDHELLSKQHLFDGFVHQDPHDLINHFAINERNSNTNNNNNDNNQNIQDIHQEFMSSGYQTPMTMETGISSFSLPVLYQYMNEVDNDEILSKQEGTTEPILVDHEIVQYENDEIDQSETIKYDRSRKSFTNHPTNTTT